MDDDKLNANDSSLASRRTTKGRAATRIKLKHREYILWNSNRVKGEHWSLFAFDISPLPFPNMVNYSFVLFNFALIPNGKWDGTTRPFSPFPFQQNPRNMSSEANDDYNSWIEAQFLRARDYNWEWMAMAANGIFNWIKNVFFQRRRKYSK